MSSRPRLLDLFCGAGGAAMGYHRAGFKVVGEIPGFMSFKGEVSPAMVLHLTYKEWDRLRQERGVEGGSENG